MPRYPLSAYNFFFSEEREVVLAMLPLPSSVEEEGDSQSPSDTYLEGDKVKKSHKKTHGKITLQVLSKLIGQRWRDISEADVKRY